MWKCLLPHEPTKMSLKSITMFEKPVITFIVYIDSSLAALKYIKTAFILLVDIILINIKNFLLIYIYKTLKISF
jgi:hypothetical protein